MSKFVAGTAVERLEYDFTDFDGGKGFIPEPTRGAVKSYFKGLKALMRETADLRGAAEGDSDEMSDEEVAALMAKADEAEERSEEYHTRSIGLLAELCGAEREEVDITVGEQEEPVDNIVKYVGGSPTYDELQALPFRVFQAFNQWLVTEIQPKKTTPGTKR